MGSGGRGGGHGGGGHGGGGHGGGGRAHGGGGGHGHGHGIGGHAHFGGGRAHAHVHHGGGLGHRPIGIGNHHHGFRRPIRLYPGFGYRRPFYGGYYGGYGGYGYRRRGWYGSGGGARGPCGIVCTVLLLFFGIVLIVLGACFLANLFSAGLRFLGIILVVIGAVMVLFGLIVMICICCAALSSAAMASAQAANVEGGNQAVATVSATVPVEQQNGFEHPYNTATAPTPQPYNTTPFGSPISPPPYNSPPPAYVEPYS